MSVSGEVAEKLSTLREASAVALRRKTVQYFDAIQGMLDRFAMKKNLEVVYVTTTIPAQSILSALEVLEVPMDHIWLVDCISQIMMSQAKQHPHAIIVESPTMLENIMLKVEFLLRKDRKSTRLKSSHRCIWYAVFLFIKKMK